VTPPLQQPDGQVWESHEHVPLVVSQTPLAQAAQAAPPAPHWEADSEAKDTHVLPLQQPLGHELELHTHWPVVVLHAWPEAQAPQATPPAPQEAFVSDEYASHVPLDVQQPLGHEVELHTHWPLPSHAWPAGHAPHAAPPFPQEPFDSLVSASHVPLPRQQPAQEPPPHVHAPPEHELPLPHSEEDCEP